MPLFYAVMDTPIGLLWLASTPTGLCRVGLPGESRAALEAWLARHFGPEKPEESPEALALAMTQLREYFSRLRRRFDLPLDLRGTPFQRRAGRNSFPFPTGKRSLTVNWPGASDARRLFGLLGGPLGPTLFPSSSRVIGSSAPRAPWSATGRPGGQGGPPPAGGGPVAGAGAGRAAYAARPAPAGPLSGVAAPNPLDAGSQRSQFLLHPLVPPVYLLHVADNALSPRTERRAHQRHPRPNVRADQNVPL